MYKFAPADRHESNVFGAASRFGVPVVYGSSATIYGDNAELRLNELAKPRPMTSSGADKLAIEHHAAIASMRGQIPVTGLRLFNVYGSMADYRLSRVGVIEQFVGRLLNNEVIRIFGDGEQVRDFVYIKDAVRFLIRAMESRNPAHSVYNVCTGEAVSVNQVARSVMSILNKGYPQVHEQTRRADIRCFVGDPSLATRKLGLGAEYGIADGLLDYIKETRSMNTGAEHVGSDYQDSSQACFLR